MVNVSNTYELNARINPFLRQAYDSVNELSINGNVLASYPQVPIMHQCQYFLDHYGNLRAATEVGNIQHLQQASFLQASSPLFHFQ